MTRKVGFCVILVSWMVGLELDIGAQKKTGRPTLEHIPVLSYHNVKASKSNEWFYFIKPERFEAHLQILKKNGYEAILPEDIYEYYTSGKPLPPKPVMISFDDTRKEHFSVARPLLHKYGFKATFFIMVVSVNKKGYMTQADIKQLFDDGHCIGHHTWDHPDMRKLPESMWKKQIVDPQRKLEKWTGGKISYFAYPFGACNRQSAAKLKDSGFKAAFQLAGKQDKDYPLHTIRRILVQGDWSDRRLLSEMETYKSR
jgi:peptidoglycan/xylan/chitin deacetylase (PgdA/CDA1 family)